MASMDEDKWPSYPLSTSDPSVMWKDSYVILCKVSSRIFQLVGSS